MHFIGHDKMHGFKRRVHPDIAEMLTPFAYGDWDKAQADDHVMIEDIKNAGTTEEPTKVERFDRAVVDAALEELSCLASHQNNQPWALMVGLMLPHFPYAVSRKYYDMYDGVDIPMPRTPPNEQTYEEIVPAQLEDNRKWLGITTDGASESHVRNARRCYYGMISYMDELIGKLVSHLEELGVADNTWVIYLSDHGDNMGEHGFWSKLNFYEDSVRIPFIVTPPKCKNAGTRCNAPISNIDWMATVLELAGQQSFFEPLPGRSLIPLIEDPTQQWAERGIISDYACDGTRVPMRMVRHGRWKACFSLGFPPTLFDLKDDPYEWNDLGGKSSAKDILEELYAIACSDGWKPEFLRKEILLHKRRLKYISKAEEDVPLIVKI
jgi:choline-sulfatase